MEVVEAVKEEVAVSSVDNLVTNHSLAHRVVGSNKEVMVVEVATEEEAGDMEEAIEVARAEEGMVVEVAMEVDIDESLL